MREVAAFLLGCVLVQGCTDQDALMVEQQQKLDQQGQRLSSILGNATPTVSTTDGSLTIQMSFGSEADLDLYVTDPHMETVYFAKSSTRSGGRISKDIQCASGSDSAQSGRGDQHEPRIEEVRFDAPIPGRYRIGIDYPLKCAGGEQRAAFAVSVMHNGEQIRKSGSVTFENFDVVVMEFEI